MAKESLYEGRFLRVIREGRWEYAERPNASGAVMIAAVTPERELVLVEEFRIPVHAWTIGLPAGLAGDSGTEDSIDAARRELFEEAGYRAGKWSFLCRGPSSPGLSSEMVEFYLAEDLEQVSCGGGVDHENMIVHKIPLSGIREWIAERSSEGKIIDPKIYLGLYFLDSVQ